MNAIFDQLMPLEEVVTASLIAQLALSDKDFREKAMLLFDITESQVRALEESLGTLVENSSLVHSQGLN